MNYVSLSDFILIPLYLGIILFFSIARKNDHIESKPYYKYYVPGLFLKIGGGIALCLIYTFYYTTGGDTLNYFDSDLAMINLLFKDPSCFFNILFVGNINSEQYSWFDYNTTWPYYWGDHNSFFVIRVTCLIVLLGMKSFLTSTILLAWLSYLGNWKLYEMFCEEFPSLYKRMAVAILFIPSVAFWGSGLLKDTITYSACCWFTYAFYSGLIKRRAFFKNIIIIVLTSALIMAIKPYILYCLLPGVGIWLSFNYLRNIKNSFFRMFIGPLIISLALFSAFFMLQQFGGNMGRFSMDEVLERAVITQNDLVKDYYGGNTFDIGSFDATIPSMLSKSPAALMAGLFRPFLWEAGSIVMILSALENAFLLYLTISILLQFTKLKIIKSFKEKPLVVFSFVFAMFFAFMVGLTTPNFGSLVRYRIPAIPFFLASLFILRYADDEQQKVKE